MLVGIKTDILKVLFKNNKILSLDHYYNFIRSFT